GPLAGAGVRVGALPPHRQVAPVAHSPVGADLHEAFDVHGDVLAEVPLHPSLAVDDLGDPAGLLFGEVLHPYVGVDPRLGQDLVAPADPDPVDVGEGDFHPLLSWEVDACDACHSLPLPLFVLLVGADHVDDAPAPHHLALHADLLDRRPYFHLPIPRRRAFMPVASRFGLAPCRRASTPPPPSPPAAAAAGRRSPPRARRPAPGSRSPARPGRGRSGAALLPCPAPRSR